MIEVSQDDLAKISGVSGQTIIAFENGKRQPYASTVEKIRTALETAGVVFLDQNGNGPGVALSRPDPTRPGSDRTGPDPQKPEPDAPGRDGTRRDDA